MNIYQSLRDRFKTKWINTPGLNSYYSTLDDVLIAAEAIGAKRQEIVDGGKYSTSGAIDATRDFVAAVSVPRLKHARNRLDTLISATSNKRKSISVPAPDPADVAAAVRRAQLRDRLFAMTPGDRAGLLIAEDASDELIQAVFEGDPILSGVGGDIRTRAERAILERRHPKEFAQVEDQEGVVEILETAMEIAVDTIRREAGFEDQTETAFNEFMATASTPLRRVA